MEGSGTQASSSSRGGSSGGFPCALFSSSGTEAAYLAGDSPLQVWGCHSPGAALDVGVTTLGVKADASKAWEILRTVGIDPAPDRATTTWAQFLRSQAEALLAADFIETVRLTGTRIYVLAVIERGSWGRSDLPLSGDAMTYPSADKIGSSPFNPRKPLSDVDNQ